MKAKNYYGMAAMMLKVAHSNSTIKLHSTRSCNVIDKLSVMSRVEKHPLSEGKRLCHHSYKFNKFQESASVTAMRIY
jgi:hypothetical protein